jgi:predicted nucleotidyltransferase
MRRKIPKSIAPILQEVKKKIREVYGSRLKGIILYGSYARGEADEGSDIDLIVLLENAKEPSAELDVLSNTVAQIDLKYDTLISIVPVDEREFQVRRLPLIMNVRKEGIPV